MLKKQNRINKKSDFDRFFGLGFKRLGGQNISSPCLILKVLPKEQGATRVCLIVNNKIDNRATFRNRIKRQIRETVRLNLNKAKVPLDLLFVAQTGIKNMKDEEIRNEVLKLLTRVLK